MRRTQDLLRTFVLTAVLFSASFADGEIEVAGPDLAQMVDSHNLLGRRDA